LQLDAAIEKDTKKKNAVLTKLLTGGIVE